MGQGTTTYALDYAAGNHILAEETITGTTLYLYGGDCLGEYDDAGDEWLYYLHDAEGMVRQGTDEQGEVVSTWLFDPDGTLLEGPEGLVSHLICGGVYDWSTGLIYKDGRYFDPILGIWLALMPLVVVQSWRGRKKGQRGFPWVSLVLFIVYVSGTLTACGAEAEHHCVQEAIPTLCTTVTSSPTPSLTPIPGDVVATAELFVGRFQWQQLDFNIDSSADDFFWCLLHNTRVDINAQGARMNCWEMILLAAYEAGEIEQSTLYQEGASDCLYCNYAETVSRVEDYLGFYNGIVVYNDGTLTEPGSEIEMPENLRLERGQIVFFNRLDMLNGHVALAVGEEDGIISLWSGPNGMSSVQRTTVEEIMEWKDESIHFVKLGYPEW